MKFIRSTSRDEGKGKGAIVMRRVGFRGRWLTVYWHAYTGAQDRTDRLHAHPWKLAISILLRGRFSENFNIYDERTWAMRRAPSVQIYGRRYKHRIDHATSETRSLFIGLLRDQEPSPHAALMLREGASHYTEVGDGDHIGLRA